MATIVKLCDAYYAIMHMEDKWSVISYGTAQFKPDICTLVIVESLESFVEKITCCMT